MSSIVIESRQANGSMKQAGVNGQYTTSIMAPITIEDQDTIQIRNVFIDSVDQASTIPVISDTTLTMQYITFTTLNTDTIIDMQTPTFPPWHDTGLTPPYEENRIYFHSLYGRYSGLTEATRNTVWNRASNLLGRGSAGMIGDGFQYCATVKTTANNTHQQVNGITIYKNDLQFDKWGENTLTWFYTNTAGHAVSYQQHVPFMSGENTKYEFTFPDDSGPVYLIADGFALHNAANPWQKGNPNFNMELDVTLDHIKGGGNEVPPVGFGPHQAGLVPTHTSTAAQIGDSYTPVIQTKSITIKAGNYNPSVLSNIISRKFQSCIGNLFKDTSYILNDGVVTTAQSAAPLKEPTLFQDIAIGVTLDGLQLHLASIDDARIIGSIYSRGDLPALIGGCANFEVDFDNDTQTFKIPKLHTEYYYNAATSGAPQYIEGVSIAQLGVPLRMAPGTDVPEGWTATSKWTSINHDRGCIVITALTSTRADGEHGNFWFDELGFSPTIQCPVHSVFTEANSYYTMPVYPVEPAADPTPRHVPNFGWDDLNVGERRTAPYITPEFLLPEGKFTLVYEIADQVNANNIHPIEVNDTTAIFGTDTLAAILARDAYFKVVINGVPANRLHSEDSVEFISSIVSKYYSGQSYTNGFTTDSIIYVHEGAPIQISAFDINIYNSDNTPAVIGADNTIFIEVTKARPDGLD